MFFFKLTKINYSPDSFWICRCLKIYFPVMRSGMNQNWMPSTSTTLRKRVSIIGSTTVSELQSILTTKLHLESLQSDGSWCSWMMVFVRTAIISSGDQRLFHSSFFWIDLSTIPKKKKKKKNSNNTSPKNKTSYISIRILSILSWCFFLLYWMLASHRNHKRFFHWQVLVSCLHLACYKLGC